MRPLVDKVFNRKLFPLDNRRLHTGFVSVSGRPRRDRGPQCGYASNLDLRRHKGYTIGRNAVRGELAERSMAPVLKTGKPKGFQGSNP